MQAVTIRPEWAFAIDALGCRVVSKDYKPEALLGSGKRIALHAGKHVGGKPGKPAALRGMIELSSAAALYRLPSVVLLPWEDDKGAWMAVRAASQDAGRLIGVDDLPTNVIFGTAELDVPHGLREYTWAVPGQEHWRLKNFQRLEHPVECAGHQGIWTLSGEDEILVQGGQV